MVERSQKPVGLFQALALPVLIAVVGLPMAFQLIPPNAFYGVRTSETLASVAIWYRSNFWSGVAAVLVGLLAAGANLCIVRSSRFSERQKRWVTLVTGLMAAVAMASAGLMAI
jgi:uncharacterized membrane protein